MDQNEPQDEALIYEQSHLSARVSKKRQLVNVGGSNEPNAKQKAKKVPWTPIWPLQETRRFAGPSTGTRSQVRQKNPMIVTTDATPVPGAGNYHHVAALHLDNDTDNEDI